MNAGTDGYVIRQLRADDWAAAKHFRLAALRDPAAPVAFLETYDQVRDQPDQFWRDRAAAAADGGPHRQFVAETAAGQWVGSVTVLIEEPGTEDFNGDHVAQRQAHVVAVFVDREHRGTTVTHALFRAALDWARAQEGVCTARLCVHPRNGRAEAFYRKAGFRRTRMVGGEYEMIYELADG